MHLYQGEVVQVEVRERGEWEGVDLLWIGLRKSPPLPEMKKLTTVTQMWARNTDRPFVLWPEQVSDPLTPPDLPTLLHIVTTLLDNKDLIQEKLICTCVQTDKVDGVVKFVKDQFLSFYKPIAPFDLVEGEEEAIRFVSKCVTKTKKKTHQKDAQPKT